MKDQYFGDARDYFKYDVLEAILLAYPGLDQLTCIWMLTPPDATGQGRVPFVPDPELPELTSFFRERQDPTHRRVAEMPTYLGRHGHSVFSYRDDQADFSNLARSMYFRDIPATALIASLVFFDPDNGLEPTRASEKHLLYSELVDIVDRMDDTSVVVIFQYFRREPSFWEGMGARIAGRLGHSVLWIVEPAVGFYVIPKETTKLRLLWSVLDAVSGRHTPRGRGRRRVGMSTPPAVAIP